MSILIKGLNIPKKGELQQDELILRITPDGEVAKYDKLFGFRNKYKAIDIPSHGRLIDCNKLEEDIKKYHLSDGKYQHWAQVQPTVIEAEE